MYLLIQVSSLIQPVRHEIIPWFSNKKGARFREAPLLVVAW